MGVLSCGVGGCGGGRRVGGGSLSGYRKLEGVCELKLMLRAVTSKEREGVD